MIADGLFKFSAAENIGKTQRDHPPTEPPNAGGRGGVGEIQLL